MPVVTTLTSVHTIHVKPMISCRKPYSNVFQVRRFQLANVVRDSKYLKITQWRLNDCPLPVDCNLEVPLAWDLFDPPPAVTSTLRYIVPPPNLSQTAQEPIPLQVAGLSPLKGSDHSRRRSRGPAAHQELVLLCLWKRPTQRRPSPPRGRMVTLGPSGKALEAGPLQERGGGRFDPPTKQLLLLFPSAGRVERHKRPRMPWYTPMCHGIFSRSNKL
ncbi:hypothetical protein SKAU_G00199250 [Synaphobranchus kaupii]|uniref:Uncharacterized protein n=1 Tax=Synaphobranchus kaupii TaxID=118154 RepID=A0A9Q1IXP4_SYNKA|nr:hypothetical protein SKAU_G00199250 [Synaphobranchus kaupii]